MNSNPDQNHNPPFYDEEGNLHVTVTTGGSPPSTTTRILPRSDKQPRPSGLAKGAAKIKDSFFDPLPDEVLEFFDPHPNKNHPHRLNRGLRRC